MHTQTNESLLGSLAAKYMDEIEDKNALIGELLKQKNEIDSKLQNASTKEDLTVMQEGLENLIRDYQDVCGERCSQIGSMIKQLKTQFGSRESHLHAEEDIMRLKSAIDLATRDNN